MAGIKDNKDKKKKRQRDEVEALACPGKRVRIWPGRLFRWSLAVVNLVVVAAFVVTAWGGAVDPRQHPYAGVVSLALPITAALTVAILIVDLCVRGLRRMAVLPALALLASAPTVWSVYPLNVPHGALSDDEKARSWTLMSYNVLGFIDLTGEYPGGVNPTISKIIRDDADVVCLQEAEYLYATERTHITPAQIDTLARRYPYVLLSGLELCLLSKYPAQWVAGGLAGHMAIYRINVQDRPVTVFNVHLQSIGLTQADRRVASWRHGADYDQMRIVADKLASAGTRRADEVTQIESALRLYGGPNLVFTGDFNDVPGCFTLRQLEDHGLREVWPAVGFGYKNTFNRSNLFIPLDHTLWRGDFRPVKMAHGDGMYSDHYPLLTTFVWDKEDPKQ